MPLQSLKKLFASILLVSLLVLPHSSAHGQWVARDHRAPTRGPWIWALPRELPQLFREFNGIDFGHAHLAETLLQTQDGQRVETARLEVLEFINSAPPVPPDEEQIAPNFFRLVWEVKRAFDWAHEFHRTLYDIFASDKVEDKDAAYRRALREYLEVPDAITSFPLDLHGKLWSFPESKSFRDKFPKFNTQIWAYHWLQGATYDVQLMGGSKVQRKFMPGIIAHYHGYLRDPPLEWKMMPMTTEVSPGFVRRFPEASAIFDNLHMLHDNIDDVLSRPDLYGTHEARRERILEILQIYLHRNHVASDDLYAEYRLDGAEHHSGAHQAHSIPGPRPPSAMDVLGLTPTSLHSETGAHHEHGQRDRAD